MATQPMRSAPPPAPRARRSRRQSRRSSGHSPGRWRRRLQNNLRTIFSRGDLSSLLITWGLVVVTALALDAARAFPLARAVGWDIGLSTRGPVLIEGNHDFSMAVTQRANHKGLYQGELRRTYLALRGKRRPGAARRQARARRPAPAMGEP